MPPRSRLESLPAELLSGILTRCNREDLVNLAQTHSNLRTACRKELTNYPLTMKVTSDNLKSWVAYFRQENTLLTQGVRSLAIDIAVTRQDLLEAFDNVDPTVFDMDARPIHPDSSRIFPLPSSLRKFALEMDRMRDQELSSKIILLLLRLLPERCPHLEELSIESGLMHQSDEINKCIHRLTHLRKLHINVRNLPNIPSRLPLLPASLTDIDLWVTDIQTQEEVTTTVTWVRGIRKVVLAACAPQGIANVLTILSRGGATHLAELDLYEKPDGADPAAMMSLREALTVGLQEFSLLQPPLHTLSLAGPSAWSDSLHLPLLHTAVAYTLTQLTLQDMDTCIFPSHLSWPLLQSLELNIIPKMGYQGPLTEPIFPVLTALTMYLVHEVQAPEDLFPALETIKWESTATPEQVASLVRHDIKHIDMAFDYPDGPYEPWEAMGGHIVDLVTLHDHSYDRIKQLANNGERIFPEFPNIRKFTVELEY